MENLGLVLAGGGSRGAYQVGAILALEELGIKANIVTGTSVGSINATFYAQKEIDLLNRVWNEITFEQVMDRKFKWKNKSLETLICSPFCGGFSVKPLGELIKKYVNEDLIRKSDIKLGMVYTRPGRKYTPVTINDIPNGQIVEHILTSSSAIPFLKKQELNGVKCYDGFYTDNLPVELAINMGATKIISIEIMKGFRQKVKNKEVKIFNLKPTKGLGFLLNFDQDKIKKNLQLGYNDVMAKKEELLNFINS